MMLVSLGFIIQMIFLSNYDERYVFKDIGYNLRMTDIAASLGIEQLKKLDSFNEKRGVYFKTVY